MGQTRMFRDRVVSMEQTLEGGEKHLPLLKELCREALPDLEYREHVLDHERDLFVMEMQAPDGSRKRIAWTRMVLFDAERIPTMAADATGALRAKIVEFIRSRAAKPEILVTFRHLEEGWVDTPEPKREGGRRRRRGGRGRGERGERGPGGGGGERRPPQQAQQPHGQGGRGPQGQRGPRGGAPGPQGHGGAGRGGPGPARAPQPPGAAGAPQEKAGAGGEGGAAAKRRRRFRRRRRGGGGGGPQSGGPAPAGGGDGGGGPTP